METVNTVIEYNYFSLRGNIENVYVLLNSIWTIMICSKVFFAVKKKTVNLNLANF